MKWKAENQLEIHLVHLLTDKNILSMTHLPWYFVRKDEK